MRRIILAYTILAVIITTMNSCGKYEEGPNFSLKTKKARITNKWKAEHVYFNENEQPIIDDGDSFIEIKKNSDYRFFFQTRYGITDYTGKWQFYDSKKKLIVTYTSSADTLTILRLKENELWVSQSFSLGIWETHYKSY